MISLALSLLLEGAVGLSPGVGVVSGPDPGRAPATLVVPAPSPDPGPSAPPGPCPSAGDQPDQARDAAQVAQRVHRDDPSSRVLRVTTCNGEHRVRVLRNGQVRVVVVPQ